MFSHIEMANYSDFEATVEAQVVSSPTRVRELSVIFRATTDLQNFYFIRLWSGSTPGDDHFQLIKYIEGEPALLQTVTTDYLTGGTWFVFKLSAKGDQVRAKVWKKGTPEPYQWDLTVTDPDHVSGLFALATYSTKGRFDNVRITFAS